MTSDTTIGLQAEIHRLRTDSDRLDWLLLNCTITLDGAIGQPWECTLLSREEIDRAREAAKTAKEKP